MCEIRPRPKILRLLSLPLKTWPSLTHGLFSQRTAGVETYWHSGRNIQSKKKSFLFFFFKSFPLHRSIQLFFSPHWLNKSNLCRCPAFPFLIGWGQVIFGHIHVRIYWHIFETQRAELENFRDKNLIGSKAFVFLQIGATIILSQLVFILDASRCIDQEQDRLICLLQKSNFCLPISQTVIIITHLFTERWSSI